MRVSISGSAGVGKSTLVDAFKRRWPMYQYPMKTYRDILIENNLGHSTNTSDESQLLILDWMMVEQKSRPKGSKTIYDRCSWDNLSYTLQGNALGKISDEVTAASISLVKESLKDIDIIFWIKYNPKIKLVEDGVRDVKKEFVKGTEAVFTDLFHQYMENLELDLFYPKEDCPAIIAIDDSFSSVDDRLMFIGEFLDQNGDLIETKDSILDPANNDMMLQMLKEQEKEKAADERLKKIIQEFKK